MHAQLGLQDKGQAIIGYVVCYVVWLGSMKGMSVRSSARCRDLVPCCGQDGYRAQVTPTSQKHSITYYGIFMDKIALVSLYQRHQFLFAFSSILAHSFIILHHAGAGSS